MIPFQEQTMNNPHEQYIARLNYEDHQRKDLNAAYVKLEEARNGLEKFIRDKRESLCNVKPQLASILEKTKPVQEYLNLNLTAERDQLELCKYLPAALFVLYDQIRAYGQALGMHPTIQYTPAGCLGDAKNTPAAVLSMVYGAGFKTYLFVSLDTSITVSVEGSLDEARTYRSHIRNQRRAIHDILEEKAAKEADVQDDDDAAGKQEDKTTKRGVKAAAAAGKQTCIIKYLGAKKWGPTSKEFCLLQAAI